MSLTDRQKQFIKFYIETGKPKQSAVRAGYSEGNASKAARELLKENVHVMRALQEIRENMNKPKAEYNLEAAMAEADEAIAIAKTTENAASFLAAVKLKAQLMKILDDKPQSAAFHIQISGISDGGDEIKTVVNVTQSLPSLTTGDRNEEEAN